MKTSNFFSFLILPQQIPNIFNYSYSQKQCLQSIYSFKPPNAYNLHTWYTLPQGISVYIDKKSRKKN